MDYITKTISLGYKSKEDKLRVLETFKLLESVENAKVKEEVLCKEKNVRFLGFR